MLSLCACHISKAEEISINDDNWSEYFEIYKTEEWLKDEFEDVISLQINYSIRIKDKYTDKVQINQDSVDFKITYYDYEYNALFYWDESRFLQGENYMYKSDLRKAYFTYNAQTSENDSASYFKNIIIERNADSDRAVKEHIHISIPDEIKVVNAKGTIHLYK